MNRYIFLIEINTRAYGNVTINHNHITFLSGIDRSIKSVIGCFSYVYYRFYCCNYIFSINFQYESIILKIEFC